MPEKRWVTITKWVVLIGVIPVVLAIFYSRESGQVAGNVKPASERKQMTDFSLPDLQGANWKLSAHRGDVVLVNFWATWCPPCREETPGLVRVARSYASKGLSVAGVVKDDDELPIIRKFVSDYGIGYPVLMPRADFDLANNIESLPTTLLIDRQGRVAKIYVGRVREAVFRADVELLLREPRG